MCERFVGSLSSFWVGQHLNVGCGGMRRCGARSPYVNCHRHLSCHCFSSVNPPNLTGCHSTRALPLTHVKTSQIVSVCTYCSRFLRLLFSLPFLPFYSRSLVVVQVKGENLTHTFVCFQIKPRTRNAFLIAQLHCVACVCKKQWHCTTWWYSLQGSLIHFIKFN